MQIVERREKTVVIDGIVDSDVRSRNFAGKEKKDQFGKIVNSEGRRNFLLMLPEDIAEELKDRGCEVKYSKVTQPNDVAKPYVSVNVSYYLKPVEAYMISNGITTPLDEAHVHMLDGVDFGNLCLELDFGKVKVHPKNNVEYVPIFAQKVWAEIVPNYIASKYGAMMPGAVNTNDLPFQA